MELIENQEKSFITATTMGTHAPYDDFMFGQYEEWVENLSDVNLLEFNNYIQKLRELDRVLGMLIEYVENSDEKTLLIAYGDHFPALYDIAEMANVIKDDDQNLTPEKYPVLFEVPYIIFSNVQENIELEEKINPSKIGMYILDNVKLEKISPVYRAIYSYFKGEMNKENYELLQYDNVQGDSFWTKYIEK